MFRGLNSARLFLSEFSERVTDLGYGIIEATKDKALELKEQITLAPLRTFKQNIQERNTSEIKTALSIDPLLPTQPVPDCESNQVAYSFLAFAELEIKDTTRGSSFHAMLAHDQSMATCLADSKTSENDIARIIQYRPELLLTKIAISLKGQLLGKRSVLQYLGYNNHLAIALQNYKNSSHRKQLSGEIIKEINAVFSQYLQLVRAEEHSSLIEILTPYCDVFSTPKPINKPTPVHLRDTPLGQETRFFNSAPLAETRENELLKNKLSNFQQSAVTWYIELSKLVWFKRSDKQKLIESPQALYQAAQLINADKANLPGKDEKSTTLAKQLGQHRRWSAYSWLAKQAGIQRSPSTFHEILSLLVSMPKYQGLMAEQKKAGGEALIKRRSGFVGNEKKLHDFQEAVCFDYLKKRGTVWFSNGNKARLIAEAKPATLFKAVQLIKTPAQMAEDKDTEAVTLARQLSQHRRWSWFSRRGQSTCTESLLEIANSSDYQSLFPIVTKK